MVRSKNHGMPICYCFIISTVELLNCLLGTISSLLVVFNAELCHLLQRTAESNKVNRASVKFHQATGARCYIAHLHDYVRGHYSVMQLFLTPSIFATVFTALCIIRLTETKEKGCSTCQ
jgi:hypothetical protein